MIKNPHIVEQFELEYEREHPLTLDQKFDLFEWMYEQARYFGHFDAEHTPDNHERVIEVARILNEQIQPPAFSRNVEE